MKIKILAFLLTAVILFTNFSIRVYADEASLFSAVVETVSGEKWGYIDESGKFVIQPQYSFVREFNDKGIAIVANGGGEYDYCNIYFINRSGKVVSGPFSSYIPEFRNGVAILTTDKNGSIVVDENGKVLFKSSYKLREYSDGLISFSDENYKAYGFMNLSGKIVIPAKYESVEAFNNGKAIVEVSYGKYSVIDKTGKVLENLKYYDKYNTNEGLTAFYEEKTDLYGYKRIDGTIALTPSYNSADTFSDGYAVVGTVGKDGFKYGLIDKKGQYVLKPEFSGIAYLEQGMYAASKQTESYFPFAYSLKALFNDKGEQLTDYKFYNITLFDGDHAIANDNANTFFIDKEGNVADNLPKLKGIGDIKHIGNLLQAKLDGGLTYMKESGEIVWQKDRTIPLGNGISVKEITYRRDYLTLIQYPQITDLDNPTVQSAINKKLKEDFIGEYQNQKAEADDDFYYDISTSFSASKNKDLLIIEKSGYWYPIGAAHGMPSLDYIYIDLKTGVFYQLKDLFLANSKYEDKLTPFVKDQIALDNRVGAIAGGPEYFNTDVKVSADQHFILGSDSLKLYYDAYELAFNFGGFPEFEIPYGKISSIINTKGAFWNSFDKKIVNQKIKLLDVDQSTGKFIENLINSYENNIVKAINNNAFRSVEPYLLNGSSLYDSQKSLVTNLYKKNTKERLNKFEIYAIEKIYGSEQYRVYVSEEIAIKYSGKDYVNKKYSWCYTVTPDKNGNLKLSSIVKW